MDIDQLFETVSDEKSFLAFARALTADRISAVAAERERAASPYGPDAGGWENVTIEHFLESAVAWAEDSDFGARTGHRASNPWKLFANFLYAGKFYE